MEGATIYTINADGVLERHQQGDEQVESIVPTTETDDFGMNSSNTIVIEQAAIGHEVEVVSSMNHVRTTRPFHTSKKPSLLRRGPRTSTISSHITAYPPQISPSVLSRFGQINQSPTASYLALSNSSTTSAQHQPSVSSLFYDRKPKIVNSVVRTPVSSVTPASTSRNTTVSIAEVGSNQVEEIVIWQPGENDDCEIVEVDEEQLRQIFKTNDTSEQIEQEVEPEAEYQEVEDQQIQLSSVGDDNGGFQQYIVYDGQGIQLTELLQNYMVTQQNTSASGSGRRSKTSKVSRRKLNPEVKCQEEGCEGFVHNVIDLRKHLQTYHMVELDEEVVIFTNDQEFKAWRANYERDRKVSFIYRGGTKKISPEKAVTYLICHRSGIYKPTPGAALDRKRKMKPQGTCKIGQHCTAGVKLLKNLINGCIEATICHTHYGHELENIQHLRVNVTIKEIILAKFDEGLSFTEVLQYVHHNPDGLEGLRVVDRRAIRNIYDQWKKCKERSLIEEQVVGEDDKQTLNESNPLEDTFTHETTTDATTDTKESSQPLEKVASQSTTSSPSTTKHSSSRNLKRTTTIRAVEAESASESESRVTPVELTIKIEKTESLATGTSTPSTKRAYCKAPKPSFFPGKSLNESVHTSIEKLLDHGESGPTVLFYKQIGSKTPLFGDGGNSADNNLEAEDLCVVLQTPVQRQLLQQFGKIIFTDVVAATDLDLMVIAILDEFLTAIPVAWMICSEIRSALVEKFFKAIKRNCEEVNCEYFFSQKNVDYHKIWCKAFSAKPRILFSQEETTRNFGILVKRHFEDEKLRQEVTDLLHTLVVTPDRKKYEDTLKSLKLKNSSFLKLLGRDWLLYKSQWAFHSRLQIPLVLEDSFLRLKKFVYFKGTKKLSRNIDNVLKIGYDRCFQRNKNLYKGDLKFHQTLNAIKANHDADFGEIIKIQQITENKFLIQEKYEVFDLQTECKCKIICEACGVCAHRYWCSCTDNLNFCSHAHKLCMFSKPDLSERNRYEIIDSKPFPEDLLLLHISEQEKQIKEREQEKNNLKSAVKIDLAEQEESDLDSNSNDRRNSNDTGSETETEVIMAEILEESSISEIEEAQKRTGGTEIEELRIIAVDPSTLPSPKVRAVKSQPHASLSDQSSRRISSRIKQKVSRPLEEGFEISPAQKRKRGNSISLVSTNEDPKAAQPIAPATPAPIPTPTPSKSPVKKPGRPPRKQRTTSGTSASSESSDTCHDAVKGEINQLLDRIQNVKDQKILAHVRKSVSDLSGSLRK